MADITQPPRHLIVVFGGLGNLARHKLIPSIYRLHASAGISPQSVLLAVDVDRSYDDSAYHNWLLEAGEFEDGTYGRWCRTRIHYESLEPRAEDFSSLLKRIEEVERDHDLPGNRIYYLAVPLDAVGGIIDGLAQAGLNSSDGWTRVVLEKPFGYDLKSGRELTQMLHQHFDEEQLFRIDHFLGKDTVQNLFALRFANALFDNLWDADSIESVEITAAEVVGIETRASYYERVGVVRDMVQNHLTQILALIAMEPPRVLDEQSIRAAKLDLLEAVVPPTPGDVVLGQYGSGIISGAQVPAYTEEDGVDPRSNTPTYAAVRLRVQCERWKGVPFYIRTGKRLAMRHTHVAVRYKCAPASLFHPEEDACGLTSNLLLVTLQPDEGFDLRFQVKQPGERFSLSNQRLRFRYADVFGQLPDAYQTLLGDVMMGDRTHFVCDSEIERAWRLYDGVLSADLPVHTYAPGGWGPCEVDALGAAWIDPEAFHP